MYVVCSFNSAYTNINDNNKETATLAMTMTNRVISGIFNIINSMIPAYDHMLQ